MVSRSMFRKRPASPWFQRWDWLRANCVDYQQFQPFPVQIPLCVSIKDQQDGGRYGSCRRETEFGLGSGPQTMMDHRQLRSWALVAERHDVRSRSKH
jgi:hypothetical protein